MENEKTKNPIDWEKRRYELAEALFFHDIRHSDEAFPANRLALWPTHIRIAAEMAVEAAAVFIEEYRRSADKPKEEQTHAP